MNVVFTVDVTSKHTDTFAALAAADEVFNNEVCGKCGHEHTTYVVREVDGDKYYEKQCQNLSCRAKKPFNCNKEGGKMYFEKRVMEGKGKDKTPTGDYWGNNGWRIYNKETGKEE